MRRLLVLLLVPLLAACGVPADDAPRALDRGDAPFAVFTPEPAATQQGDIDVELWFVRGEVLVPVVRSVPSPSSPGQLLELLFTGLTEQERSGGLRNAIPAGVSLDRVDVRDGVATVSLTGLSEQVQLLAFAQIVTTLTTRADVVGVRFRSDGQDVQVPRGDGSLTDEPVDRQAYTEQLVPASPGPAEVVPPTPATG